jgi:DNA-binding transcriptional ArsR family regulator
MSSVSAAAPIFFALGDTTRLQLIARLSSGGPGSTAHLGAHVGLTHQAISKHMDVLAGAGLVKSTRRGRERIWRLEPRRLQAAHAALDRISAEWDSALQRLRKFVED